MTRRGLALAGVAATALAVYANALSNGFVYDDHPQVVTNRWVRDPASMLEAFSTHVAGFGQDNVANYYRPIMHLSYALTYQAFGLRPWGFHLVSMLIHAICSILVFTLASRLVGGGVGPAFAAGLLFAVHPIHTEAVTWIAGVPDIAMTLFALLAFWLYLRSEHDAAARWLAPTCFLVAALAKEPALMLLPVLVAYDYAVRGLAAPRKRWARYVPFVVAASVYIALRSYAIGGFAPISRHPEVDAWGRILNIFPLFAQHLRMSLAPLGLNAFHVLEPVRSIFELRALGSIGVVSVFIGFVVWARKRSPAAFVGLVLFAAPLLPVVWIPWVGENTFAERYAYLPSAGLAVVAAETVRRIGTKDRRRTVALVAALALVTALMATATIHRNPVWKDDLSLWRDTVAKSPNAHMVRTFLGDAYLERGDLDAAIQQYREAIRLRPGSATAHNNLGLAALHRGDVTTALQAFSTALRLEPEAPETLNNVGLAYKALGSLDAAAAMFERALTRQPDRPGVLRNLASVYEAQGRISDAEALRQRAGRHEDR